MSKPMMKCGHVANATMALKSNRPVCAICFGIDSRAVEINESPPGMEGRIARCAYGCGNERPSSPKLPFFKYLGPGSPEAMEFCGNCPYTHGAHKNYEERQLNKLCRNFTPRGDRGHDRYYCGCRGWD